MQQSLFDFGAVSSFTDDSPAIACGEQPQQRMEHFGVTAMSDTELVAMMLQGNGVRARDALTVARDLVAEAGSLAALAGWQPADFRRMKSIGRIKGCQLSAIAEIGRRMMRGTGGALPIMNRAELIAAHMEPIVFGLAVEKFYVLCLNRKNRLIKLVEATSGTATAALAHPREVFRIAIREAATAVVCVHNHPSSGDPAPSNPDIVVTRQLREAAKAVDIEFVDHVIIGRRESDPLGVGFYSFRNAGML
jgi:DNA repair protein RadC